MYESADNAYANSSSGGIIDTIISTPDDGNPAHLDLEQGIPRVFDMVCIPFFTSERYL